MTDALVRDIDRVLWLLAEARWKANQSAASEARLAFIVRAHRWERDEARWWAERAFPSWLLPWGEDT